MDYSVHTSWCERLGFKESFILPVWSTADSISTRSCCDLQEVLESLVLSLLSPMSTAVKSVALLTGGADIRRSTTAKSQHTPCHTTASGSLFSILRFVSLFPAEAIDRTTCKLHQSTARVPPVLTCLIACHVLYPARDVRICCGYCRSYVSEPLSCLMTDGETANTN